MPPKLLGLSPCFTGDDKKELLKKSIVQYAVNKLAYLEFSMILEYLFYVVYKM